MEKLTDAELIISIISGIIAILGFAASLIKPIWSNSRYRIRAAISAASIVTINALYIYGWGIPHLIVFIVVIFAVNLDIWRSANELSLLAAIGLRRVEKWHRKKLADMDRESMFPSRPWYFICTHEKLAWDIKHITWHLDWSQFYEAYKVAYAINEKKLTIKEKTCLDYKKVFILQQLGANSQAKDLLKQIGIKNDCEYHMLESLVFEQAGDLSSAAQEINITVSLAEKENHKLLATFYADFGRIRSFMGNLTETQFYYKKAIEHMPSSIRNRGQLHICWQQLIFAAQRANEAPEILNRYIDDYKKSLKSKFLIDTLEYDNFQVKSMRQTNQMENFQSIFMESYFQLKENLNDKQAIALLIDSRVFFAHSLL